MENDLCTIKLIMYDMPNGLSRDLRRSIPLPTQVIKVVISLNIIKEKFGLKKMESGLDTPPTLQWKILSFNPSIFSLTI